MMLYKLIGTDGREYGPANAEQIRQWIRENRVERQTPVFVPGSADWTFIGLLPEFAHDFPGTAAGGVPASAPPPPILAPQPLALAPADPLRSDSMAKAGLICGALSVTIGCCCAGLPFNLLGLIFSIIALVQIAENPRRYEGLPMAVVGLLLSALSLAFMTFSMLMFGR